jgi:sulfatase modifying factor 1
MSATATIEETAVQAAPSAPPYAGMVWVPGGTFVMGSDHHYPEEAPAHQVHVSGFWMDQHPVTNEQFKRFVEATKHTTFAEIPPKAEDYPGAKPEMLKAGSLLFTRPPGPVDLSDFHNWWSFKFGADWRHPKGPKSDLKGRWQHPVVHVACSDAEAYAAWAGKTLPTEAEWECAAWGGRNDGASEFAWGNELYPGGRAMANTWQGEFPHENLLMDGFEGTSPVGSFSPNGYGLLDLIGNVWEWTSDWYVASHTEAAADKPCCLPANSLRVNPRGPREESSFDPCQPSVRIPRKVLKGGSHLCAPNYCRRYRPPARHAEPVDTSTNHVGFRCIVRQAQDALA